jgi:hypothetical protein
LALRRQLSLYVPEDQAAPIEAVRRVLDPIQHALIPAHVTLCRDEEAARLTSEAIAESLSNAAPITLTFGRGVAFEGHDVLLPCISGGDQFASLRERLLGAGAQIQAPHITLAHPRNPRAAGNSLAKADELPAEILVKLSTISLIEQTPWDHWRVLEQFGL